jgi:hypothetical protein
MDSYKIVKSSIVTLGLQNDQPSSGSQEWLSSQILSYGRVLFQEGLFWLGSLALVLHFASKL